MFSVMETLSSKNKKITIKRIFEDHWENYLNKNINDVFDYQVDEVEKMLACRDPLKLGYHKYCCPDHPDECVVVPHSCKSRFCNVCGVLGTNAWMEEALDDFPDCPYFHVTLTLPDYFWYFFKSEDKRHLLEILFASANEAVMGFFRNRKIIPAGIAVMHTFGKKINYNTHIHLIVSAGGLKLAGEKEKKQGQRMVDGYFWKSVSKLPYEVLSRRWKAVFLKKIEKHIDNYLYTAVCRKHWYVHVGEIMASCEATCRYIGRYAKRPPMAETRITDYDGEFVSFFYEERLEDDNGFSRRKRREFMTLPAHEFISRLIAHIPEPNFKMVRRYGILSNAKKEKLLPVAFALAGKSKKSPQREKNWRERQKKYLKTDPLICKICGREMILREIAFWSKKYDRLYIKYKSMLRCIFRKIQGVIVPFRLFFLLIFTFFAKNMLVYEKNPVCQPV